MQAANGDDALQNSQAENLLTQGVDVLLVAPHNGKTAAIIVESAHKARRARHRLRPAHQRLRPRPLHLLRQRAVGELQAEYLVKRKPTGNYVLIGGAPTDNNALLFRKGQMKVLQPLVDKGDIKIVSDQWAKDWQAVEALKIMENALTRTNNKVDAVVAQQRRHRGRRHPGPRPSRSWRARCWSPARTPSSPPASASWPARRA